MKALPSEWMTVLQSWQSFMGLLLLEDGSAAEPLLHVSQTKRYSRSWHRWHMVFSSYDVAEFDPVMKLKIELRVSA